MIHGGTLTPIRSNSSTKKSVMKNYLLITIFIAAFVCRAMGATPEEELVSFWEEFWQKRDDVTLRDVSTVRKPWVVCYGPHLSGLQENQDLEKRKMKLFLRLKNLLVTSFLETQRPQMESVEAAFDLEEKLAKAGGYRNKVLSRFVAELGGAQGVLLTLKNPEKREEILEAVRLRNDNTNFDIRAGMLQMSSEDPILVGKLKIFSESLENKASIEAHKAGFSAFYGYLNSALPEAIAPKSNFENTGPLAVTSVYEIANQTIGVELYLRSTVPAILAYLINGGELQELAKNPWSVTTFNEVMGDERWDFGFPFTGVITPAPAIIVAEVDKVRTQKGRLSKVSDLGL